ncbi:MAG: septum formation initiator family protein [Paracoccaceae bacterium]|nr:septum formation initiator family protein [Paracoccaceae bacterium]
MKIDYFLTVILTSILTMYFSYSALNGQYGLFNKFRFQAQEIVLLKQLDQIKSKNSNLNRKVIRLSDEYLDLDLLDQQARKFLGLMRPNEIIINFN